MSLVDNLPILSNFVSQIKDLIFGENNSRIDTVLDYFFSLRQEKRAKIVFYSIITLIFLILFIIFFYFIGLHRLQNELNEAADNVKELNNLQPSFMIVNQEFSNISTTLQKNNQYNAITSVLDQKAKDLGIESSPLPEKPSLIDLQNTDPLYQQFQKVKIDYKLLNISLRKIIDYINAIQQLENKLKITKLEIQQKFGTKLYFDVSLTVEAYIPSQQKSQE